MNITIFGTGYVGLVSGACLFDAVIFEGRNLYAPDEFEAAGLENYGIGHGQSIRTGDDNAKPAARQPVFVVARDV